MKAYPPKNVIKFLRWFCREDYVEEIEGDLTEIFEKEYEQSPRKANGKFTWRVIKYSRPGFMKSFKSNHQSNHQAMFLHNFSLTDRNFKTHKNSVLLNLSGLSPRTPSTTLI